MVAVPANLSTVLEFQDNRGYRALVEFNGYEGSVDTDATLTSASYSQVLAVATAAAALSNAKLIRIGWRYSFDYAQEPTTETGTYQLVIQKAHLQGGDGNGGFMSASIPAPKDNMFITAGGDNLIVVNPAASTLVALQTALAASWPSPRGGKAFAQFFGGQLQQGKPRIRRVTQGA